MHEVQRQVAAAAHPADVNGEAQGPAEQLEHRETVRVPMVLAGRRHAEAGLVVELQAVARGDAVVAGDVGRGAEAGDGELSRAGARDPDVADDGVAGVVPDAGLRPAGRLVQPGHHGGGAAPVGEPHRHALGHDGRHLPQVGAAAREVEDDLVPALQQPDGHAGEARPDAEPGAAAVESRLDLEGAHRVDLVPRAGAVGVAPHLVRVPPAALGIATVVVARGRREVALVGSGREDVVVRLHDVQLRAVLAADLVRIAVVGAPVARPPTGTPSAVAGRALDEVEREVAAAADAAQVHREAQGLSEQPQAGEAERVPRALPLAGGRDAEAGVVVERQPLPRDAAPVSHEVGGTLDPVHDEVAGAGGGARRSGPGARQQGQQRHHQDGHVQAAEETPIGRGQHSLRRGLQAPGLDPPTRRGGTLEPN
mmetsp:Transcript_102431/g.316067  ORF Transcript_102431/g.316067 Transcript_102431/m.316067 type:complete len:424 (-) Transcript_102431:1-1272(-)